MPNRLARATSPYLQQHRDNPVDWWEWGVEAFAEARRRDVPLLLSVGYAACHWCHVMAHESFEDAATAAYMNERFVNVKVDREERPDVDAVYMEATQAMTGHGGWPMTVFATPDGRPFYCGTYFPPRPAHRMPSFRQVLEAVADTWATRREEVEDAGTRVVEQLSARGGVPSGPQPPGPDQLAAAVRRLRAEHDAERGGFGGAPKFPPSMVLEMLLRHHALTGDADALAMAERTLVAMARGGMYDQLGGGFARYSVDASWVVPHFEKMLYDNALLLRVYLHWWRATGDPLGRRVAEETADFLLRELRTPEGGFASALDADSEGEEGRFYVWTPQQLFDVLGVDDGAWAADLLEVTPEGTFEHGSSVLQLLRDPDDAARWASVRARLLAARAGRVRPGRDDKVVLAWNGLAVAALAEAGELLGRPDLTAAAVAAGELLVRVHVVDGRLRRVSRDGVAGAPAGVLEDHGDGAEGLLALHQVTGDPRWLEAAGAWLDLVLERFADGEGGFHDTADDAEALVRRPQDPTDGATPSGRSAAAGALLSYAALTGSDRHRTAAEAALGVAGLLAEQAPRFAGWGLAVAEALVDGPREVAVVGDPADPATAALRATALRGTAPGAVLAVGAPGAAPRGAAPLLEGRDLVGGAPAAYVCRHFACERPVTAPDELAALVLARRGG
ncbi:thioredoxin domain-containing protein [Vallicoccus soli]|uniref:Thioredoxin domain-containing protein n=1 Tax=Vallicoccus soli TaxID=2339232 RepID=A0A3A3ZA50_9ACTN|nr:thioredoxin domain-containing protein [Vallicoccus soli]RJK97966.1 thioredoxin domain-containing protein [Vallicoccus soli]